MREIECRFVAFQDIIRHDWDAQTPEDQGWKGYSECPGNMVRLPTFDLEIWLEIVVLIGLVTYVHAGEGLEGYLNDVGVHSEQNNNDARGEVALEQVIAVWVISVLEDEGESPEDVGCNYKDNRADSVEQELHKEHMPAVVYQRWDLQETIE